MIPSLGVVLMTRSMIDGQPGIEDVNLSTSREAYYLAKTRRQFQYPITMLLDSVLIVGVESVPRE
jgi:hypothetical protein